MTPEQLLSVPYPLEDARLPKRLVMYVVMGDIVDPEESWHVFTTEADAWRAAYHYVCKGDANVFKTAVQTQKLYIGEYSEWLDMLIEEHNENGAPPDFTKPVFY